MTPISRLLAGTSIAALLLATACSPGGTPNPQTLAADNGALGAATSDENLLPEAPSFGNTAANVARIKAIPFNGKFSFTFMGDNRNAHPWASDGDKVYRKVIEKINQLRPTFAVNAGDFSFEGVPRHWKNFEQITAAVKVPYLTVVGNHDALFRRTYYEQNYTPANPETGLDDYAFAYGNTRLIALDDANRTITERQYAWLHKQLAAPGVQHTILMAHIPPGYENWRDGLNMGPKDTTRLMDLLAQDKCSLAMFSHIHTFDGSVTYKGVPYVISGGAGAGLGSASWGVNVYHVTTVEVDGPRLSWRMTPIANHEGQPEITEQIK